MRITEYQDFRDVLKEALSERLTTNPQYSLRAFARDLGFSPGQVSQMLSGKKGLSPAAAEVIAKKLGWNEAETEYFCSLVGSMYARSEASKLVAKKRVGELRSNPDRKIQPVELQMDAFRIISEWHHFPILELLKVKNKTSPRELAKRLGIQEIEAQLALDRLLRLSLIKKTAKGYEVEHETVMSKENISSDAVKKFHSQVLEKAKVALVQQSVDERYFRSMCFPIETKSMKKAQKEISQFFEGFLEKYSVNETADEVYMLSTQFFRLTEKESK